MLHSRVGSWTYPQIILGLARTNTLAYYEYLEIMAVKSFLTLCPGPARVAWQDDLVTGRPDGSLSMLRKALTVAVVPLHQQPLQQEPLPQRHTTTTSLSDNVTSPKHRTIPMPHDNSVTLPHHTSTMSHDHNITLPQYHTIPIKHHSSVTLPQRHTITESHHHHNVPPSRHTPTPSPHHNIALSQTSHQHSVTLPQRHSTTTPTFARRSSCRPKLVSSPIGQHAIRVSRFIFMVGFGSTLLVIFLTTFDRINQEQIL
jgi:hypothetical protein